MINKYGKLVNKTCGFCKKKFKTPIIQQKYHQKCFDIYHPLINKKRCKKWYYDNLPKVRTNKQRWYAKNAFRARTYSINYYQEKKPQIRKYMTQHVRERRKNEPEFAIKGRLRCILRRALDLYTTKGKVKPSKKYGIDYPKIMEYLKPFPKDLSQYHIDHIKPLSSFNLTNPDEIKKAFAPENHQWLTIQQNLRKSGINKRNFGEQQI